MSKKHHGGPAPVPPSNRPHRGPVPDDLDEQTPDGDEFQDQDPKRRLGDFTGAGEHSLQQPGPLKDGTTHSK